MAESSLHDTPAISLVEIHKLLYCIVTSFWQSKQTELAAQSQYCNLCEAMLGSMLGLGYGGYWIVFHYCKLRIHIRRRWQWATSGLQGMSNASSSSLPNGGAVIQDPVDVINISCLQNPFACTGVDQVQCLVRTLLFAMLVFPSSSLIKISKTALLEPWYGAYSTVQSNSKFYCGNLLPRHVLENAVAAEERIIQEPFLNITLDVATTHLSNTVDETLSQIMLWIAK